MDQDILHRYPLIRILFPLLGGIIFAEYTCFDFSSLQALLFIGVAFILFCCLQYFYLKHKYRWVSGVLVCLIFFSIGYYRLQTFSEKDVSLPHDGVFVAVVQNCNFKNDKYAKYTVAIDGDEHKRVFLYHYKDTVSPNFSVGSIVGFQGKLQQPDPPLFEESFDYAKFLMHKQIKGIFYQPHETVCLLGDVSNCWPYWLYKYRNNLQLRYKELKLEGDELALVSALTLGLKDDFSVETKESYADAGVSHVLALSGLHVGLLFVLLIFAFRLVFYRFLVREVLSLVLAVAILWLFVLFVGASPSVVRSVSLYSLLAIAQIFRRERISLNTLAFVATVLLLYNPYWIFDLGFILSFSAVTSILLFYPLLEKFYKPQNPILNYFWQLILISFVAQLGTLPWTIYYFHTIPLYFLLANIVVIPLITVLLYVLVVFVFVLWIPVLSNWMGEVVSFLSLILNRIVDFIANLPVASIEGIYLYPSEVLMLFVLFGAFYYLMMKRGAKALQLFLISLILFQGVYWVEIWRHSPTPSFKLISEGNKTYLECVESDGTLYILKSDSILNVTEIAKWSFNRWHHNQLKAPRALNHGVSAQNILWRNGIASFQGVHLLQASMHMTLMDKADDGLPIFDYLLADTRDIKKVRNLLKNYRFKTLIIPSSIKNTHKATFIQICKENNLNFITINKKAYIEFL